MSYEEDIKKLLDMTEEERKQNGFPVTVDDIAKFYKIPAKSVLELDGYNSQEWLNSKTAEADKALLQAIQNHSPSAIKTFYELMHRLDKKIEVNIGLSGDENARRNLEAARQLREGGYRVEEVPEESSLLSK